MARVSDKDIKVGGADDGKQTNMITSLGLEQGSLEPSADRCHNKQESGISDEDLTSQDPWSLLGFLNIDRFCWSALFRFISLCCSGAPSSTPPPSPSIPNSPASPSSSSITWYHSTRIQRMMENQRMLESRGEFRTLVESEIEASKATWTQMDATMSHSELSRRANREYFDLLKRRKYVRKGDRIVATQDQEQPYGLFRDYDGLVVGEKLAEGGQAEIYEAVDQYGEDMVVKVFKAGTLLRDLETQWPPALLKYHQLDDDPKRMMPVSIDGATLLKDERLLDRFAFVMERQWGDLRKLIDQHMMRSHNRGPPFTPMQVVWLMLQIAEDMNMLHGQHPPILHKDLKAANVLVESPTDGTPVDEDGMYYVSVADYECSVGVVGTGLWRAPEILQQLKDNVSMSCLIFTEKCDVYSFGMTCYELVTGRIPFEDHDFSEGCDLVLKGERLELPPDLDPCIKEIIISCWDLLPSQRPSFVNIIDIVTKKL